MPGYTPLPQSDIHGDDEARNEMDAAFDESDDEADESRPLNPTTPPVRTHVSRQSSALPGTYDFEADYDYAAPPPGSPPGPSSTALPNEYGNSNGLIPNFASAVDSVSRGPRLGWFKRAATSVLPTHYVQRLGIAPNTAVMGTNNDGVFANVTAKPTAPARIQEGDSSYIVPEETRAEAPPSYASAQADAVPQYFEVHAPFQPGTAGEMIIDNLPSGTLFSFLWNMLVSISFQFVGFLLTYLLHTTHAARLGARAGLGVTLIQYGFALRTRNEGTEEEAASAWASWSNARPTFATAAEAAAYYNNTEPVAPTLTQEEANAIVADATSEWLSFFLMTIGWFILLTSVLGFWRVKRWERGVLASQHENPGAPPPPLSAGPFFAQFERGFGLRGINHADLWRQGFGFGRASEEVEREREPNTEGDTEETEFIIPADASPERIQQLHEAIRNERRLHAELRAAGLL
uniref:Metal homeostatis protein bsd2 n=1 Tax=Mycena chlorophos TaxID=658473 RepID=A0ABQ0M9Q1_MYCCL|nr:predicted protein [Mycena chlorophos]